MSNRTKLLLAVGVLGFIALASFSEFSDTIKKESQSNKAVQAEKRWAIYNSNEFGISFDYPESWKTEERHDEGNTFIRLESDITDNDKGDMFYSLWVDIRDNPDGKSFEDLIFPKDTYENLYQGGISSLYTKEQINSLTVYKTDRLLSQSGIYHYFLTKDGSEYVHFNFFPYYPDNPQVNQDKIIEYLNKITSSLKGV